MIFLRSAILIYCLQVPFESLRRTTRDRKYLIDEVHEIVDALKKNSQVQQDAQERNTVLTGLLVRLEGLKRKVCWHHSHPCRWEQPHFEKIPDS